MMLADVFMSYSRRNGDTVKSWVEKLQSAEVRVWLDVSGIDGARLWSQEIVAAIDGCRVLFLVLSSASIASPQVRREVMLAFERKKPILPLMLEPVTVPPELRYPLAGIQQIDLSGGEEEKKLQAILRALTRLGVPHAANNNLRPLPTRFIGREQEIIAVTQELRAARLVTLTGAGGSGKTRLALRVAADLLREYADGVWVVDLAALGQAALVPQEVARALGVREVPGHSLLETVAAFLQQRQLLLVLDNCEHLIAACAALVHDLLKACPEIHILATSREPLGVPGELVWRVPTLTLPNLQGPVSAEALVLSDAVRLFQDRACLSQPSFTITDQNAPAVAQVCHRLDGIPLAIELAAVRVKHLSAQQIAARLDDRFRLLTGGSRTGLPRHQTLRAMIDWSFDLLSPAEQALLRRLSVFAGGFTLEAAERIGAGDGIGALDVLDLLSALIDKSLVVAEEWAGHVRYGMLETIRQYGRDRLAEAGEVPACLRRHRDWYLEFAEEAEPHLHGPRQAELNHQLERDQDNFLAAMRWSEENQEGEASLRLAIPLCRFWSIRGYYSEGRARLTASLALTTASRSRVRATALNRAGLLAWEQAEYAVAQTLFEECHAIRSELGDRLGMAYAVHGLGRVASGRGDYEVARQFFTQTLTVCRELGDQRGIGTSLSSLGMVAHATGDQRGAEAFCREGLAIQRELGDTRSIATALCSLGMVLQSGGESAAARQLFRESLILRRELGDKTGSIECLECFARSDADAHPQRAARLLGAVEALCAGLGIPLPLAGRPEYDRQLPALRATLGEEDFSRAWVEGQGLDLERGISIVLAADEDKPAGLSSPQEQAV